MEKKYTFIHPTKTGGTACKEYLKKYYGQYFNHCTYHQFKCTNDNNPIIIVRDVYSRFFSMFKYWKFGSIDKYKRNQEFLNKHKNKNILDFINLLKTNNTKDLIVNFTWGDHFKNTVEWINNTNYKNIIIIRYEDDLNPKIQTLINKLNIPNKNIPLNHINVTDRRNNLMIYKNHKEKIDEFVQSYFKRDIEFISKIRNNPELFKLVI